jgi:hypothetical protein
VLESRCWHGDPDFYTGLDAVFNNEGNPMRENV